jgi:hypothetical protein
MAALVNADPGLDPDAWLDGLPSDLWGALVLQVIGQQLSMAAVAAILARLEALHGGRLPTPAEMLDIDDQTLRRIGLSRAKAVYLHDLAARLENGRLDPERLRTLTTTRPVASSPRSRASAASPPTARSCSRCAARMSGQPPTWRYVARSSGSGGWTLRHRSRTWTRSVSASGHGGVWPPRTSTERGWRDVVAVTRGFACVDQKVTERTALTARSSLHAAVSIPAFHC